jgi:invasion protein IalB
MLQKYGFMAILLATIPGFADAAPAVGDRFGDWVFQCEARAEGQTDCAFVQTILDPASKSPLAQIRILQPRKDGKGSLIALLPLGLNLEMGVKAAVDETQSVDVRISTCLPRGCLAQIDLTPEVITKLKAGVTLGLAFDIISVRKRVSLNSSLSGVSSALSAAGWY